MDLNRAITIARQCLHSSEEVLENKGITYSIRCEAYNIIAEYHSKINLLYKNIGASEEILEALYSIKKEI